MQIVQNSAILLKNTDQSARTCCTGSGEKRIRRSLPVSRPVILGKKLSLDKPLDMLKSLSRKPQTLRFPISWFNALPNPTGPRAILHRCSTTSSHHLPLRSLKLPTARPQKLAPYSIQARTMSSATTFYEFEPVDSKFQLLRL